MLFLIIEESLQYSLGNREDKEINLLGVYTKEEAALDKLNELYKSLDENGYKTKETNPYTKYRYRILEVYPNEEINESLNVYL